MKRRITPAGTELLAVLERGVDAAHEAATVSDEEARGARDWLQRARLRFEAPDDPAREKDRERTRNAAWISAIVAALQDTELKDHVSIGLDDCAGAVRRTTAARAELERRLRCMETDATFAAGALHAVAASLHADLSADQRATLRRVAEVAATHLLRNVSLDGLVGTPRGHSLVVGPACDGKRQRFDGCEELDPCDLCRGDGVVSRDRVACYDAEERHINLRVAAELAGRLLEAAELDLPSKDEPPIRVDADDTGEDETNLVAVAPLRAALQEARRVLEEEARRRAITTVCRLAPQTGGVVELRFLLRWNQHDTLVGILPVPSRDAITWAGELEGVEVIEADDHQLSEELREAYPERFQEPPRPDRSRA